MTAFWSAIVNGAILSTLLSVIVWFALRLAPRHAINAATRCAIWWTVLMVTLALPVSCARWREATTTSAMSAPALEIGPVSTVMEPLNPLASTPEYSVSLPIQIRASQWLRPILVFWIAGSLFMLMRVFISYHRPISTEYESVRRSTE